MSEREVLAVLQIVVERALEIEAATCDSVVGLGALEDAIAAEMRGDVPPATPPSSAPALPARPEGESEPTLEECIQRYDWAVSHSTADGGRAMSKDGIAAVRSLLLSHRAPRPSGVDVDESAWLIERGGLYWTGREGCGAWHTHAEALRFARWQDADRMRITMGFQDAKATEHVWTSARPSPAPQEPRR